MMNLKHIFRCLLDWKSDSFIKLISLTLGLVIGLVLFSQVAFEMSYDNFHPEGEQIYRIQRVASFVDKISSEGPIIHAPLPEAMLNDIKEVQSATVTSSGTEQINLFRDEMKYVEKVIKADSRFFDVFDFRILYGDSQKLALSSNVFLSKSAALRIFGRANPLGEVLLYDNKTAVTVAGIFEDIPKNSHFDFGVVLSFQTLLSEWGYDPGWMNNDSYFGYVKLSPEVCVEEVENQIPSILYKYYDVEAAKLNGRNYSYYLKAITDLHKTEPEVKRVLIILSLLAFSLLFVSAMNYVLISISSLVRRSKSVGVYKSCGAGNRHLFALFMQETFFLIFISLLWAFLLIFVFRKSIEELIQTPISAIFSLDNLWVTLVLTGVLVVISGVIPAYIFSKIPVTQVFHVNSMNKRYWKNTLLFIQFTSIICVVSLMFIIIQQYNMLVKKDLGYTIDSILFAKLKGISNEQAGTIKNEFERIPLVVKASIGTDLPLYAMNGDNIINQETKGKMFLTRIMAVDENYVTVFSMNLKTGCFFDNNGESSEDVLVNEAFIAKLHLANFPIGKTFENMDGPKRIIGVIKDFQLQNFYKEVEPVMIYSMDPSKGVWWGIENILILKVNDLTPQILDVLNKKMYSLTQNKEIEIKNYREECLSEYTDARLFRNSVSIASAIMLLITLLGVVGYIKDELFRKRKEIAIRKINGASINNILCLISKDIGPIIIPAMGFGITISYLLGERWLQQFVVKIPLSIPLFFLSCLSVSVILYICFFVCSWRVANENPIHNIKPE